MIELFFIVVIVGVIVVDHRLCKLLKIQRELLGHLADSEGHLRAMREAYEAKTK